MPNKYESLPLSRDDNRSPNPELERRSKDINDILLPTDQTETAETTRNRIVEGFRIGDPSMPLTYEIASALGQATRSIGLSPARLPKNRH